MNSNTYNTAAPIAAIGNLAPASCFPPGRGLTRRGAIGLGALALAASSGLPGVAMAGDDGLQELDRRLAAHASAHAARERTTLALQMAAERFDEWMGQQPIPVSTRGMPNAKIVVSDGEGNLEAQVRDLSGRAMHAFMANRAAGIDRRGIEEAATQIAADEEAHLAALREALEKRRRRSEACGLTDAERADGEAFRAEAGALDAVLSYRPRSLAQVRRLCGYLSDAEILPNLDNDELARLFASLAGAAPAIGSIAAAAEAVG